MKTILSLTALATFLALLPFALAEAKSTKSPSIRTTAKFEATPGETPARTKTASPPAVRKATSSSATNSKTAPKPKSPASSSTGAAKTPAKRDSLTPTQEDKLLGLLNEGTVEELSAIPGIASTRADSIVSARPFASIHEIILVDGVGNATFEKILAYGKGLTQARASRGSGDQKS